MELARELPIEPHAVADAGIVVVGSGPVGMRFAEELCRLDSKRRLTVVGDEPRQPYDRVRLSAFLARELRHSALLEHCRLERYANAKVIPDTRIVEIDRERRLVRDAHENSWRYAKLVLAMGSRPHVPPVPGRELSGVYVFRSLSDAEALLARQVKSRSTVVIGGGLLGLEAARAMRRFNTKVHVVEHEPYLMFRQLDSTAAALLREHVEALGIRVYAGVPVQQIIGQYSPAAVRLKDGVEIECDTVVFATGIRPNIELARMAGIAVGRGIRVDDRMRTSDPDVYAVGECCEHRGEVYGLVAPGIEQAGVAAHDIAGQTAEYGGSVAASSLKVVGCAVFSMGDVVDSTRSFRSHVYRAADSYRKINVSRGRLIGAVGFGDWDTGRLRNLALEGRRIWPWQRFIFERIGRLWLDEGGIRVASWPANTNVCACRGVTRGRLGEALAAGADSIDALARMTGASTVCGSCKPLLADLLGEEHVPLSGSAKSLLWLSVLGTLLCIPAYFVSIPYAPSVASGLQWDWIWTQSSFKQLSGYTLLSLSVLVSVLTFRKRLPRFSWGEFAKWQLAHAVVGVLAVIVLLVHTGFRFGANLNLALMTSFTGLVIAGGIAGASTAAANLSNPLPSRIAREISLWMHILLFWPLPVLLGFHVLKSYYF